MLTRWWHRRDLLRKGTDGFDENTPAVIHDRATRAQFLQILYYGAPKQRDYDTNEGADIFCVTLERLCLTLAEMRKYWCDDEQYWKHRASLGEKTLKGLQDRVNSQTPT